MTKNMPSITCEKNEGGVWGCVVIFAAFFIQVLAFGTSQSIGVYNVEFLRYFDAGAASVSLVGSINLGVMLGAGPLASFLMSRWSHRQVALLGAALTNIGLVCLPFAPNLPYMYLFYGAITGLGESLIYVPSHVLSGLYFVKHRSLATGVATAGSGLGSTIFPIIIYRLMDYYGWRGSLLIVAGLNLHLFILAGLLRPVTRQMKEKLRHLEASGLSSSDTDVKQLPPQLKNVLVEDNKDIGKEVTSQCLLKEIVEDNADAIANGIYFDNAHKKKTDNKDLTSKSFETIEPLLCEKIVTKNTDMYDFSSEIDNICAPNTQIKNRWQFIKEHFKKLLVPGFVAFWFSNIFWNAAVGILMIFLPEFMISTGFNLADSSLALTMLGAGSCIGCIVGGVLGNMQCCNRIVLYMAANVFSGLFALCFPFHIFHSIEGHIVLVLVYGLMFGIILGLLVVVTSDLLGVEALGDGFGFLMLANGIGIFSGPPFSGVVIDTTGSVTPALYISGACSLLSAGAMVIIPIHQRLYPKPPKQMSIEII